MMRASRSSSLLLPVIFCFLAATVFLVSACGDDDPVAPDNPSSADYDLYVDRIHGDDAFDGSYQAPFRTITTALAASKRGNRIKVAPGTYDHALGEIFPLQPDSVQLIGDEAGKGAGPRPTLIIGGATVGIGATMNPGAHSIVAGFTITNNRTDTGQAYGVVLQYDNITLRNCSLINNASDPCCSSSAAVIIVGSRNHLIAHNVISHNDHIGLSFNSAGDGIRVEFNEIRFNKVGIQALYPFQPEIDLGGGTSGSKGGNSICCNSDNDLVVIKDSPPEIQVFATNNFWDHTPPTVGQVGADFSFSRVEIDTSGSRLAVDACP